MQKNNFKSLSENVKLYKEYQKDKKPLTFEYLEREFKKNEITFDAQELALIDQEGNYTFEAFLFSDQNTTETNFRVYQGKTRDSYILGKKDFDQSLLRQIENSLYFSELSNAVRAWITKQLAREEYSDIPSNTLEEVILYIFSISDYTLKGNIEISYHPDRFEIHSLGYVSQAKKGEKVSDKNITPNRIIVNLLKKLGLCESENFDIEQIFSSYADFYKKLRFEISDNRVVITLFNPDIEKTPNKVNSSSQVKLGPKKLVRQEKILALISKDKNVSALKLAKELEVSLATIKRDLSTLSAENKIEHIGGNRYGHWIVKKD